MISPSDIASHLKSTPAGRQWEAIGIWPHHGVALPLFSIHTENSCGIGEFLDLIPLINWCQEIGFDVIQLLPLNDTGQETSPYSAISAYAINPLHLSLTQLPDALQDQTLKQFAQELQEVTKNTKRVDYKTVQERKDLFLRRYYQLYGERIEGQKDYTEFKENHRAWLGDYALFKSLKILQDWLSWEDWPQPYKDPTPAFTKSLPLGIIQETQYQTFLQYLCFTQFASVVEHARNHQVLLKGDIPILINRESADVWSHRDLFSLQLAAGAPPDMYSKEGQKWGFPLYNWDVIAARGYDWWIGRLKVASHLYHLYRIDHIVGFFRIWGIPLELPPKEGSFYPADRSKWIQHGKTIMQVMLESCDMLPIGEDLGTVPPEVRTCLRQMGICGTKVMRWERRWDEDRGFINPSDYPTESMTTVSTHDSETLAQWWKDQRAEAELFAKTVGWSYAPELTKEQRFAILHASHHSGSLFHINLLQEYLALFPEMVWPELEDERINIPGLISDRNWSYRTRPFLEEIIANQALKQSMITLRTL